jgi:hypothetical protein
VSFDNQVGSSISASVPQYTAPYYTGDLSTVSANSLGIRYNVLNALTQVQSWIGQFKSGQNPAKIPVAAVQADLVTHSMGGVLARTMPLLPEFWSDPTYNQGWIHKLITIDTPHLGTPLAGQLLGSTSACVRGLLANNELFSFSSVTLNGSSVPGAVGDLQDSPLSPGLNAIAQPGRKTLPTALIAGIYTSFTSLDCTTTLGIPCAAQYIRTKCGQNGDLLGQKFTSNAWPLIFGPIGSNSNDALVPLTSQLNGLTGSGFRVSNYVHSPSTEKLSFSGPSVLDAASPVPNQVITLLNTPYTDPNFQALNP